MIVDGQVKDTFNRIVSGNVVGAFLPELPEKQLEDALSLFSRALEGLKEGATFEDLEKEVLLMFSDESGIDIEEVLREHKKCQENFDLETMLGRYLT